MPGCRGSGTNCARAAGCTGGGAARMRGDAHPQRSPSCPGMGSCRPPQAQPAATPLQGDGHMDGNPFTSPRVPSKPVLATFAIAVATVSPRRHPAAVGVPFWLHFEAQGSGLLARWMVHAHLAGWIFLCLSEIAPSEEICAEAPDYEQGLCFQVPCGRTHRSSTRLPVPSSGPSKLWCTHSLYMSGPHFLLSPHNKWQGRKLPSTPKTNLWDRSLATATPLETVVLFPIISWHSIMLLCIWGKP